MWFFKWVGLLTSVLITLTGCYSLPLSSNYKGPQPRPPALDDYYRRDAQSSSYTEEKIRDEGSFIVRRFTVSSSQGPFIIDYYQQPRKSDGVVFVFPLLGGKRNLVENYFAEYFAKNGIDAAIVHRNEDFKKPENFDRFEEVMRANIIRDRMAIDFFEDHLNKKKFGTFGISRGAINVAISAGVDPRLKYNVMLMGGSDLIDMFKHSDQKRIRKFVHTMMAQKNMSEEQIYEYLRGRTFTDPKYLARFIDGRNSLLILAQFDRTVPIKNGYLLRQELGDPETIFLMAGHYTSILYTSFANILLPTDSLSLIPLDYVESESLNFFNRSLNNSHLSFKIALLRTLRFPFDLIGRTANFLFASENPQTKADRNTIAPPWEQPVLQAATAPMCITN